MTFLHRPIVRQLWCTQRFDHHLHQRRLALFGGLNSASISGDQLPRLLDALTRIEAQRLVEDLWREHGFTALLVTHDVSEAVLLADRVLLIEEGRVAESFEVAVPRPRRRDNAELARIAGAVLDRIFSGGDKSEAPPSGSREKPSTNTTLAALQAGV